MVFPCKLYGTSSSIHKFIFLTKYVFPTLLYSQVLVRNYVEMRSLGGRSMKTITATPRQLESLIRLAQALAKMRLSESGNYSNCIFVNIV